MALHDFIHGLLEDDRQLLVDGEQLEETHVLVFHKMLREQSSFKPQRPALYQNISLIEPVAQGEKYIQILHCRYPNSDNPQCPTLHWVCLHYDTKSIQIFDSMNYGRMPDDLSSSLTALFPQIDLRIVQFPKVQYQTGHDCGYFAIAFAVSLAFGMDPTRIQYDVSKMKNHLLNIFDTMTITHFPYSMKFVQHSKNAPIPIAPRHWHVNPFRTNVQRDLVPTSSNDGREGIKRKKTSCIDSAENDNKQKMALSPQVGSKLCTNTGRIGNYATSTTNNIQIVKNSKFPVSNNIEQRSAKNIQHDFVPKSADDGWKTIKRKKTCNVNSERDEKMQKLTLSSQKSIARESIKTCNTEKLATKKCTSTTKSTGVIENFQWSSLTASERQIFDDDVTMDDQTSTKIADTAKVPHVQKKRKRKNVKYTWQGLPGLELQYLDKDCLDTITNNEPLKDTHMSAFTSIIHNKTKYLPYETIYFDRLHEIKPVPRHIDHIQILPGNFHWICAHYEANTNSVRIYDSNCGSNPTLNDEKKQYLKKLFPYVDETSIIFPKVQQQENSVDCGVFTIAFATSLLLGTNPEYVAYDKHSMRQHLLHILQNHQLQHFPVNRQDCLRDLQKTPQEDDYDYPLIINNENKQIENDEQSLEDDYEKFIFLDHSIHLEHSYSQKSLEINKKMYSNTSRRKKMNAVHYEENKVQIVAKRHKQYEMSDTRVCLQKNAQKKKNLADDTITQTSTDTCSFNKRKMSFSCNISSELKLDTNVATQGSPSNQTSVFDVPLENSLTCPTSIDNKPGDKVKIKQAQNTKKKYAKLSKTWTEKKRNEIFVQKLIGKLNHKSTIESRMQAEKLVKWCLESRKNIECSILRLIKSITSTAELTITKAKEIHHLDSRSKLLALCGESKHNTTTEAYFLETPRSDLEPRYWKKTTSMPNDEQHFNDRSIEKDSTYACNNGQAACSFRSSEIVPEINLQQLINTTNECASNEIENLHEYNQSEASNPHTKVENDKITNPQASGKEKKKVRRWQCDESCKLDDDIVFGKYLAFLRLLMTCTIENIHLIVPQIKSCGTSHDDESTKRGHPRSCYENCDSCDSTFIAIHILAPHFPSIRYLRTRVYIMIRKFEKILALDNALENSDKDYLEKEWHDLQEKVKSYQHENTGIILNEEDIEKTYLKSFINFTKMSLDVPKNSCVSCEKLLPKRDMQMLNKLRKPIETTQWSILKKELGDDVQDAYICKYCLLKFRNNKMPPTCFLNNLQVPKVPQEILCLNDYEILLIQRAKAFQVVTRMETVAKKQLRHKQMIQKVKGRTFHLPLPIEETLKKICPANMPVNNNHELHILVRGLPNNKTKVVWEQLVDVKKVFAALLKLKTINPHYKNIRIPKRSEDLLKDLQQTEFNVQPDDSETPYPHGKDNFGDVEEKNLGRSVVHESITCSQKGHTPQDESANRNEGTENTADNAIPQPALLTPALKTDPFYEHYTIYPIHEKKINETATDLYQMKKIINTPLDNREKLLDLLCFPALYPFGNNGQHENRPIPLTSYEYIKHRLISKYSQFRRDIQYIFYLLNDNNIRQLNRGIYQMLNVPDRRMKYTAATYLKLLKDNLIEKNLNNIFATLRNTEQYWKIPRSNLICMAQERSPATWFLTLSPSEYAWTDMIQYLREINSPHMDKLPAEELTARDPVSVSRFLDNKFHAMLEFICSNDAPLGKVIHYFWRREYQGRGTQHFHLLLWVENAPVLGESTNEEVAAFILKYITCKIPKAKTSPILYERVREYQTHKHNSYCLRNKKTKTGFVCKCRFGFPRAVNDNLILRNAVTSIAGRKGLHGKSRLYDLPRGENEKYVNDYNPVLLSLWNGNMDLQFIGEVTRMIALYITKYGTKSEKSHMTNVLKEIDTNKSLASSLWAISLRGLTHRECGALEAADSLLGIALHGKDPDTKIKWLDINEIRSRRLKPKHEIDKLKDDATNIFFPHFIDDHYPQRPEQMETCCLYDFAKKFDIVREKPKDEEVEYYVFGDKYLRRRKHECLINHYKYNVQTEPEKYFHALLLLFKPWRDAAELKNGCATYTEAFQKESETLLDAMKYHKRITEIQSAIEKAEELIREQMAANDEQQSHDRDQSLECNVIEANDAMKDFKGIDDNMEEVNMNQLLSRLNSDQQRIFYKITESLLKGYVMRQYISGEGGTGKSYLIHVLRHWVKQQLGKRAVVAAPTGLSAFNINGLTIYKIFSLPVEYGCTAKYQQLSDKVLKMLRAELSDVAIIIIDEVSMINNVILMYIHLRLSEIFDTSDVDDGWFGKKSILLLGDLLQLPPVRENPAFVELSSKDVEKFIGSFGSFHLWQKLFHYDELRINMRQKNDDSYRDLLGRIRLGIVTTNDAETLEKRKIALSGTTIEARLNEICEFITALPSETVCLFPTRHMCNVFNEEMLKRISSNDILIHAKDSITCPLPHLKKKIEESLKTDDEDCSKTGGLPQVISIKIGAKVMLTRNIDVSLGLVNGTISTVKSITRNIDNQNQVDLITLVLPSGTEENIQRMKVKFSLMDKAFIIREQFPLCLSYAITVHKSQGLSLKTAVIDAGNKMFAQGQVYVALSRVTSLDGLHLINFDPSSVKANPLAILEYNRLREVYRSDLPSEEITYNHARKVCDTTWTSDAGVFLCQKPVADQGNTLLLKNMRGLLNNDGVSCYANSAIHCIFNSSFIKSILTELPKHHRVKMACDSYFNNQIVDVAAVRSFTKVEYAEKQQQDVAEFINHFVNQLQPLEQIVTHEVCYRTTCANQSCKHTTTVRQSQNIFPLSMGIAGNKAVTFKQLLDMEFQTQIMEDTNFTCKMCLGKKAFRSSRICSIGQVFIVQFLIFKWNEKKGQSEKLRKYSIKSLHNVVHIINGENYKLCSAIFHEGSTLQSGHYTTVMKVTEKRRTLWFRINDAAVRKEQWPRSAQGAYVLFFEKHK